MPNQCTNLDDNNKKLFISLLDHLKHNLAILPDKPEETPKNTLYALWHFVNNMPRSLPVASTTPLTPLNQDQHDILTLLVEKRIQGTPLAYITGRQSFMGLELHCDQSALIPRKETELLAQVCVDHIVSIVRQRGTAHVLDLFTGSGNLPLCFKDRAPGADIYGSDISEEAISLARQNAQNLGLTVNFLVSDVFDAFPPEQFNSFFDIISGAPPYISSAKVETMADEISKHEPSMAFEAGPFGIKYFSQMIKESPRMLKTGGKLIFEVGLGQGEGIAKRIQKNNQFDNVRLIKDENGDIRVLEARLA